MDIEMTKEEQLSFFNAVQDKRLHSIETSLEEIKDCLLSDNRYFIFENGEDIRSLEEVQKMQNMFFEKIWLDQLFSLEYRVEHLGEKISPEIWEKAQESAARLVEKYGEDEIGPYSDFEWGMINGKLSALRWVLGDEWDMLDT